MGACFWCPLEDLETLEQLRWVLKLKYERGGIMSKNVFSAPIFFHSNSFETSPSGAVNFFSAIRRLADFLNYY